MAKVRNAPVSTATPRERTPAAPPARPSTSAGPLAPEQIAARAYEIWIQSGRPEGTDQENWFRAERELRQSAVRR